MNLIQQRGFYMSRDIVTLLNEAVRFGISLENLTFLFEQERECKRTEKEEK